MQLCEQARVLNDSVTQLFDNRHGGTFDIESLVKVICSLLSVKPGSFLVIDALDECLEDDERPLFYQALSDIHNLTLDTRIMITSRTLPDITAGTKILHPIAMDMRTNEVDSDIRIYVHSTLDQDPKLNRWSLKVRQEIEDTLTEKSGGMYEIC